ncbi:MAG: M28 family peptidase [Acidobacteriota bacterium]
MKNNAVPVIVLLSLLCRPALSQTTPFMSEKEVRALTNEISGDTALEHVRWMTHYHRPSGSRGFEAVLQYVYAKAREYGLENVRIIRQRSARPSWTAGKAELWIVEPEEIKLTSLDQVAVSLADYSRTTDLTAELADVGTGESEADYDGRDVGGKIVLAGGSLDKVMEMAVWKRGALGIVSYASQRQNPIDHPDQIAWQSIPVRSADGKPGTFAFVLSIRQGEWLRELVRKAKSPVRLRALVESEFTEPSWQAMCEAFIMGTDKTAPDIVYAAHLQEEKTSANDNGSGCAALLEIARSLKLLSDQGKIRRPLRSLRFWWTTENSSEAQFFSDFPEERTKILAAINLDMVGAKQSLGSRVQHVTLSPASRPGFLNDITEHVVDLVRRGNTPTYAAHYNAYPFTRPILAHLGTREGYNILVLPFFTGSEHVQFLEAVVGVPAVGFLDWPDEYIHGTDDDLWNVDPTQIQRNAVAAAAIGYLTAVAGEGDAPIWAAEVYGNALARMGRETKLALQWIGGASDPVPAYRTARNQVREAVRREIRAVDSLRRLSPGPRGLRLIADCAAKLRDREAAWLAELDHLFQWKTGAPPPQLVPEAKDRELSRMIPVLEASPKDYYAARQRMTLVPGLHTAMALECLAFVDGKNSFLDIFNAVSAEALAAGDSYYGPVTRDMVEQFLSNAVKLGAIRLKDNRREKE